MKKIEELFDNRLGELERARDLASEHVKLAIDWGIDELEVMKENVLALL